MADGYSGTFRLVILLNRFRAGWTTQSFGGLLDDINHCIFGAAKQIPTTITALARRHFATAVGVCHVKQHFLVGGILFANTRSPCARSFFNVQYFVFTISVDTKERYWAEMFLPKMTDQLNLSKTMLSLTIYQIKYPKLP